MNWIDVTKKTPPQNTPVLFYSRDLDAHLVGYWSEYDNCMVQYPDDREGWKWSVSKWAFIDKSDSPTCTANERKFLDEIREKGEWASSYGAIWLDNGSEIFQSDLETDLRKLIKGE